jgi:hypothetical protein
MNGNYCEYVLRELDSLTHWLGWDCDRRAWLQICTGEAPRHALVVDMPTLPLCAACLMLSEILEPA